MYFEYLHSCRCVTKVVLDLAHPSETTSQGATFSPKEIINIRSLRRTRIASMPKVIVRMFVSET
jgi:hypothetical protein